MPASNLEPALVRHAQGLNLLLKLSRDRPCLLSGHLREGAALMVHCRVSSRASMQRQLDSLGKSPPEGIGISACLPGRESVFPWLAQLDLLCELLPSAAAAAPAGSEGQGPGRVLAVLVRFALASIPEVLQHVHTLSQTWEAIIAGEQCEIRPRAATWILRYWIKTSQHLLDLGPSWTSLLQLAGPGALQREREVCSAETLGALVAAMAADVEGRWSEEWGEVGGMLASLKGQLWRLPDRGGPPARHLARAMHPGCGGLAGKCSCLLLHAAEQCSHGMLMRQNHSSPCALNCFYAACSTT